MDIQDRIKNFLTALGFMAITGWMMYCFIVLPLKITWWLMSKYRGGFLPEHRFNSCKISFCEIIMPGCGKMKFYQIALYILAMGVFVISGGGFLYLLANPTDHIVAYPFIGIWAALAGWLTLRCLTVEYLAIMKSHEAYGGSTMQEEQDKRKKNIEEQRQFIKRDERELATGVGGFTLNGKWISVPLAEDNKAKKRMNRKLYQKNIDRIEAELADLA